MVLLKEYFNTKLQFMIIRNGYKFTYMYIYNFPILRKFLSFFKYVNPAF